MCCLPAVGVNGHGGAQGDRLAHRSPTTGWGVPRVLVSRHALEAIDRQDALTRAGHPARAGGYGHVYAFATGEAFVIETTGQQVAVLDGPQAHTNHYLDPGLAALGPEPAPGSVARLLERLRRLLDERAPTTVPEAMDILRDHDSTPQAICLHPDLEEGEEASAVMFSMVADLGEGRMWVAPGNPCETEYEEVDLSGERRALGRPHPKEVGDGLDTPLLYERLTWPEVRTAAAEDRVCLIPAGVLEDHGPHLPLDADSRIATEICRRTAEELPDEVVLLPTLVHGYTPHHMDFPGPDHDRLEDVRRLRRRRRPVARAPRLQADPVPQRPWVEHPADGHGLSARRAGTPRRPVRRRLLPLRRRGAAT